MFRALERTSLINLKIYIWASDFPFYDFRYLWNQRRMRVTYKIFIDKTRVEETFDWELQLTSRLHFQ